MGGKKKEGHITIYRSFVHCKTSFIDTTKLNKVHKTPTTGKEYMHKKYSAKTFCMRSIENVHYRMIKLVISVHTYGRLHFPN